MGRKVSIKERATTDAALEILKTAKNQNLKAQMVKLLFETDAREKARADAHERQRRAYAHNKELAALGSQIDLLAEKLQAQLKVLHDYWLTCEVPEVDRTGRQLVTDSEGKLGERFEQAKRLPADNQARMPSDSRKPKGPRVPFRSKN